MGKLLVLNLQGDFDTGFDVNWEIGPDGQRPVANGISRLVLPPRPDLVEIYRQWQDAYRSLDGCRIQALPVITNVRYSDLVSMCRRSADDLAAVVNEWLDNAPLSRMLQADLLKERDTEYRVIIGTENPLVRQIPWLLWRGWQQFPQLEISLGAIYTQRHDRIYQQQVRILAILGDSEGIDIEADRQILDRYRRDGAEIAFLPQPTIDNLRMQLADDRGWDIIFFSGHSRSERHDRGRIYLDRTHSLTMAQLRSALTKAIDKGLQLAIFNSCDGLGIAAELEDLHIPQVIVMRQPVPDRVAQVFLKDFLAEFTSGKSLYRSVSIARQRLQQLEADFPCASWLPVIVQNRLEVPPTWQSLGSIPPCPYPGLAAFTAADKDYFYGRDREIEDLINAVNTHSIVPIVGASGSGKSSLVFAGLVPRLDAKWQIVTCQPGAKPLESLALAIDSIASHPASNSPPQPSPERGGSQKPQPAAGGVLELGKRAQDLGQPQQSLPIESTLADIIDRYLSVNSERWVLLIVDRWEDLYTLNTDPVERKQFIDRLARATQINSRCKLVVTIRSDYYQKFCAELPHQSLPLELQPLSGDKLQQAIVQPAAKLNVQFETGLIDKILQAIASPNYSLPLLQFTLNQLWQRQKNGYLTHHDYQEIGGIETALSDRARNFYERATPQQQDRIRAIFIQLVQFSDNGPPVRRIAKRSEIGADNWELVNQLAAEHLLAIDRPNLDAQETISIVHQTLIDRWDLYQKWIERDGKFRRWQEQLRADIERWEKTDRDRSELLRGKSLDLAKDRVSKYSQISPLERDFINLSIAQQHKERRKQILIGLVSIAVIVSGIGGAIALDRTSQMERNEKIQKLTKEAEGKSDSNPADALTKARMAVESIEPERTSSDISLPALVNLANILDRRQSIATIDKAHERAVTSVAYTADDKIASIGEDGKLNIYDASGKKIQSLSAIDERFSHLAIAADGDLYTVSNHTTLRLWNYNASQGKWSNKAHKITVRPITSLALSTDGKTLAIALDKGGINLYRNFSLLRSFETGNYIYDLKFSPDNTIVTAHADGKIGMWSETGNLASKIDTNPHKPKKILRLAIAKDGSKIASGSETGKIQIWDRRGTELAKGKSIVSPITSLNFATDGRSLVSTQDKQIDIWTIADGQFTAKTLLGHTDRVNAANFSVDGRTLVSASDDRAVRIWQATTDNADPTLPDRAKVFSYNSDGRWLLLGTAKGNVSIVDRDKLKIIKSTPVASDSFTDLKIAPDDRHFATAGKNRQVKLWQLDEGNLPINIATLTGDWVAWIDSRLAVVNGDRLDLYDLQGKLIRSWQTQQSPISYLNSHANTIVTGDTKGTVKFWNAQGQEELSALRLDNNPIIDISCERYCQKIAIVSGLDSQAKVTLWNANDKSTRTIVESQSTSIAFSQDGRSLLIGNENGKLELRDLKGRLLTSVRQGNNPIRKVRFGRNDREILAIDMSDLVIYLNLRSGRLLERDRQVSPKF